MKITKSQLNAFSYCPYRYKREYIDKVKFPPNDAMMSGTRMHKWFEWFFSHWKEVSSDKWELLIPDEYSDREKEMCKVLIKGERERLAGHVSLGADDEFTPPYLEHHVDLPEMELHGYIDRIDYWNKNKNEFVIVELKTGFGHNVTKLKQELAFYKYIFEEAGLGKVPYYLVINPNRRVREYIPASSRGVAAVKKRIEVLRKAIAEDNFPKKCSPEKKKYCNHCPNEDSNGNIIDGECYTHQI
jgi:CRISPR/Cas system-associated exonuclease Cas4 (RecB family)